MIFNSYFILDIKFAEIRLILFYDEWVLLKEFQNHEAVLSKKLYNKKKEKLEIESKVRLKIWKKKYEKQYINLKIYYNIIYIYIFIDQRMSR